MTSHNIIVIHNQLIRFPDIAFFVSPIPLHIAAMVILFGHMSKCERLAREVAMEDVWMALNMLPSFRWRWERKDLQGGHPLIGKLAEQVLKVNLHQVAPTSAPMLMSEQDWDTDGLSPKQPANQPQQSATPPMRPGFPYPPTPGPPSAVVSPNKIMKPKPGAIPGTPQDKKLAELPAGLFYPFYPGDQNVAAGTAVAVAAAVGNGGNTQALTEILATSGSPTFSRFGYPAPPGGEFIMEEKEGPSQTAPGMQMWINGVSFLFLSLCLLLRMWN